PRPSCPDARPTSSWPTWYTACRCPAVTGSARCTTPGGADMRLALRGLTTRGRSFLAAALAAGVCALALGERDLLRVAVLLAALPLAAAIYVGQARYRLSCARSIEPARVPVGVPTRVMLRLSNLSRLPTGTLLLEDRLPYALGNRPRLVLERLTGQRVTTVAYTVRAEIRGKYEIGPLMV